MPEEDPGAESCLCRGSQDVGSEHHVTPAESVARDATDEQEQHEGNRLSCQHYADFGRRRMAQCQYCERERHRRHAGANRGGQLAEEVEPEIALVKSAHPFIQAHVPDAKTGRTTTQWSRCGWLICAVVLRCRCETGSTRTSTTVCDRTSSRTSPPIVAMATEALKRRSPCPTSVAGLEPVRSPLDSEVTSGLRSSSTSGRDYRLTELRRFARVQIGS